MRVILFIFLTYWTQEALCQKDPAQDFENFAHRDDSLMRMAYTQKDVKAYEIHLKDFLTRYNKLGERDKKAYSGVLAGAYYNFCCTYSLLHKKQEALVYLRKAANEGYLDYEHMQQDSDLNPIRNENEFQGILAEARNLGDYLYILKKAEKYNPNDRRKLPPFTYQSKDNPDLAALREAFKLDSVAGEGSDVFRIINLLHWVHYLIPHDGMHPNPAVMNAMAMIKECKRDKRGLNCRGLATVLNECYLSLGIRSRIVTCLPKDSLKKDGDCHVINMVYSDSLKKWLWIDPTNDAYVMNEKGEMLSIEEVRYRIIHDQLLVLNPDANWNRKAITKEDYLYHYMAKNLYRLECPVRSEYDMEARSDGKVLTYVQLLPLDYFEQGPDRTEKKDRANTVWVNYQTNNPALFWARP